MPWPPRPQYRSTGAVWIACLCPIGRWHPTWTYFWELPFALSWRRLRPTSATWSKTGRHALNRAGTIHLYVRIEIIPASWLPVGDWRTWMVIGCLAMPRIYRRCQKRGLRTWNKLTKFDDASELIEMDLLSLRNASILNIWLYEPNATCLCKCALWELSRTMITHQQEICWKSSEGVSMLTICL